MSNKVHVYTIDEMLANPAMVNSKGFIVPPVGSLFDFNGTTLEVMVDKDINCQGCYFNRLIDNGWRYDCFQYRDVEHTIGCTSIERESEESVIFAEKGKEMI